MRLCSYLVRLPQNLIDPFGIHRFVMLPRKVLGVVAPMKVSSSSGLGSYTSKQDSPNNLHTHTPYLIHSIVATTRIQSKDADRGTKAFSIIITTMTSRQHNGDTDSRALWIYWIGTVHTKGNEAYQEIVVGAVLILKDDWPSAVQHAAILA